MMAEQQIDCAVVGPYRELFTYKMAGDRAHGLEPGCRLLVPFGNSIKTAFFVEGHRGETPYRLKAVKERIDLVSPFPERLFSFYRWIADYYFAGIGETLAAALPGAGSRKPRIEYHITDQEHFRKFLHSKGVDKAAIERAVKKQIHTDSYIRKHPHLRMHVKELLAAEILSVKTRTVTRRPKTIGYRFSESCDLSNTPSRKSEMPSFDASVTYSQTQLTEDFGLSPYMIRKLVDQKKLVRMTDDELPSVARTYPVRTDLPQLRLLDEQKDALRKIVSSLEERAFAPYLLFGITGSGKTLVYCHAAKRAIERGGAVLVLVPEIALSGVLLSSFSSFFGDTVSVLHSALTPAQRLEIRERILSGEIKIVIGPRSAVFAPLRNLNLIIVDEEHDPSYKQDDPAPRYHGRDAAVMLARTVSCPIILGSASPSIESYHNAVTGRYTMLRLTKRPTAGYRMPEIIKLDMKREKIAGECSFLSYRLKRETERRIADGGQVIYYLNRRGFSPKLKCDDCGFVPVCPDCGVTLTYHRADHKLKCHLCDRSETAPDQCPSCRSRSLRYIGTGTQRVEENLGRLFSDITAERLDSDRAATKDGQLILGNFAEENFKLLLGTQMVTKGLDFPSVTLVGVLSADIGLDMPDFRAAEKSYARLLQVAGRTGRGEKGGLVMIQTYYDDHPVISNLIHGDYVSFVQSVLEDRKELFYPPFSRLVGITLTSPDERLLEREAVLFRIHIEERLAGSKNFRLIGPSPAPLYKIRGQYRRRLFLKCGSITKIVAKLRSWEREKRNFGLPAKIKPIVDVDPMNMM